MKHLHPTLLLSFLFLVACTTAEAQIKEEIAEANYCETAADCVDVGGKCPFDCYIFVNTTEVDRIKTLVDGYNSQCVYSCLAMNGVECVQGKCKVIQDAPPAEEE